MESRVAENTSFSPELEQCRTVERIYIQIVFFVLEVGTDFIVFGAQVTGVTPPTQAIF